MRLLRGLRALWAGLIEMVVVGLPGPAGTWLRGRYWGRRLRELGAGVQIDVGVQFVNPAWISIGDGCWIDRYAILLGGPPHEGGRLIARRANDDYAGGEGELVVGPRTHVAAHSLLSGHGGLQIDGSTTIGAGARVYSLSHHHRNLDDDGDETRYRFGSQVPPSEQALISAPVVIALGAAIGTNAVVLPGVTVGEDTWVGAGSVVTGSLEPGGLAWGAPARVDRPRWTATGAG
jgi:acetyltransferase-like isoleucine patch superfamily enzyme